MLEELKTVSMFLSRETEIYTELLGLENEKTRVLLKGKPQELDRILNEEQPLIMKSEQLESERLGFQRDAGLTGLSLKELAARFPESRETGLEGQREELVRLIEKLKKANSLNKRLVDARLRTTRRLTGANSTCMGRLTYTKEGVLL